MLNRNARYCPMCKTTLEVRVRRVAANPRTDRSDRYLWCKSCRVGIRIQKISLDYEKLNKDGTVKSGE